MKKCQVVCRIPFGKRICPFAVAHCFVPLRGKNLERSPLRGQLRFRFAVCNCNNNFVVVLPFGQHTRFALLLPKGQRQRREETSCLLFLLFSLPFRLYPPLGGIENNKIKQRAKTT